MTINLSKKKDKEILRKIQNIKKIIVQETNDKIIIQMVEDIEQELLDKKYGLVIENHLEAIETNIDNLTLKLEEVSEYHVEGKGIIHTLIEGENLLALKFLIKTYKEKIDVICIDPPYHTGSVILNYDDSKNKARDDYCSHSKWLSFMDKRLKIAYDLLTPNGALFLNIDETQIGCLILLCQQLFGEKNIDVLIWPKTDLKYDENRIEKPYLNVKIIHEYVILCYKNKASTSLNKVLRRPSHSDFSFSEQLYDIESILNELGTTSSAKDELEVLFGKRDIFSTPKPMKMMKEFVRAASKKNNSIILDFFAGSGTTGHAVMDLNSEDGGNRTCILVTNDENRICSEITLKRLKKAIELNNYKDGWKYFRL